MPLVHDFIRTAARIHSAHDLQLALAFFTTKLGFEFFALTHHVDILRVGDTAIRVHNYPDAWVEFFDRSRLGPADPVHRASHRTSVGFTWSQLPTLIRMTPGDRRILALAGEHDVGEGFTVPANVPGESRGSVSFAVRRDTAFPSGVLPAAQLVGAFAFESARRIWRGCEPDGEPPRLTDRQRDCLIWSARGKSDWETSVILGVSKETVIRHMKQARERYGVPKRASLIIRTLLDGTISLADIARR